MKTIIFFLFFLQLKFILCKHENLFTVSASPPKQAYQMKKLDEAKRVKISSPTRTSRLYPDLTNLSSSETETETEFTIESTEAETATLDEATETGTEAEYYVKVSIYLMKNSEVL